MKKIILLFILVFGLSGCGSDSENSLPSGIVTKTISAESGGSLELVDGTTLDIPAGALDKDTKVTITVAQSFTKENDGYAAITLEPEGLQFNSPVLLTIPYEASVIGNDNIIVAYTQSSSIPEFDAGSEISQWEQLPIVNKENSLVTVELNHFSSVVVDHDAILHTILQLPGQYLRKTDLIYTLSFACLGNLCDETFDWFPGHVGMYLGAIDSEDKSNDYRTIIESTPDFVTMTNPGDAFPNDHFYFMTTDIHMYMGARRYNGSLSDEDIQKIASYAIEQEGEPYALVGDGKGLLNSFSCVGLTESAYEAAGKNIIPEWVEWPIMLPKQQFKRTVAVDEITHDLDVNKGAIYFYVHGRLKKPDSRLYHYISSEDFPDEVVVIPSGLTDSMVFEDNRFLWNDPKPGTYTLSFTSKGTFRGTEYEKTQDLTINVVGERPSNGTDNYNNDFSSDPLFIGQEKDSSYTATCNIGWNSANGVVSAFATDVAYAPWWCINRLPKFSQVSNTLDFSLNLDLNADFVWGQYPAISLIDSSSWSPATFDLNYAIQIVGANASGNPNVISVRSRDYPTIISDVRVPNMSRNTWYSLSFNYNAQSKTADWSLVDRSTGIVQISETGVPFEVVSPFDQIVLGEGTTDPRLYGSGGGIQVDNISISQNP